MLLKLKFKPQRPFNPQLLKTYQPQTIHLKVKASTILYVNQLTTNKSHLIKTNNYSHMNKFNNYSKPSKTRLNKLRKFHKAQRSLPYQRMISSRTLIQRIKRSFMTTKRRPSKRKPMLNQ